MHDHDGLCRLARRVVDRGEIGQRGLRDDAEAGAEAERVLQAARDDAIGDADVDHVRQLIACSRLRRGEADIAGIAADDCRDAGRIHLLDLGGAAFRRRLRIAEHGIDLAETLDAAGGVDLLDRECGAEAALLSRIGQRTGDRMQHAEFHGPALRAQDGRHHDGAGRRGRRGEETTAIKQILLVRHDDVPPGSASRDEARPFGFQGLDLGFILLRTAPEPATAKADPIG